VAVDGWEESGWPRGSLWKAKQALRRAEQNTRNVDHIVAMKTFIETVKLQRAR